MHCCSDSLLQWCTVAMMHCCNDALLQWCTDKDRINKKSPKDPNKAEMIKTNMKSKPILLKSKQVVTELVTKHSGMSIIHCSAMFDRWIVSPWWVLPSLSGWPFFVRIYMYLYVFICIYMYLYAKKIFLVTKFFFSP